MIASIVKNTSRILEDLYDLDKIYALDAMLGSATPNVDRRGDIILFKQSLVDKLNKIIYYLNSDIHAAAAPADNKLLSTHSLTADASASGKAMPLLQPTPSSNELRTSEHVSSSKRQSKVLRMMVSRRDLNDFENYDFDENL